MRHILIFLFILLAACTIEPVPVDMTRGMGTAVPTPTALPTTFLTATPTPMPDLAGTAWELVLINGRTPIPNSRITLEFADGRAGGFAGCNEYGGDYTSAMDGTFTIAEIAQNTQGCLSPEGMLEQENAYVQALTQAVRYDLQGDQLALLTAVGETTLTFTRQPRFAANPADLVGVAWQLVEWHGRDLLPDTTITLVFDGSGAISGNAGCRHYLGSYQAENDNIRFPMLSMVGGDCDLGEAYLVQEGDFTTALSETRQYRIENGQLELFTNPGERLLFVTIGAEIVPSSGETPEQPAASPIQLGAPRLLGRGQIVDAAFTPDGTGIAVAWPYGVSFTAVTGAAEQWFQPLPTSPVAIDVRPDGQAVAVALADGNVVELAVADGRAQTYPVVHATSRLGDIAYAPDGRRIAVQLTGTNRFDPIFVLDLADGRVQEIPETSGGGDTNPYLVWSPDGTAVTLGDSRGCGHIVDVQTGERLFRLQSPGGCYSSNAVAWSPDGRTLTLSGPNDTIDTIEFASHTVMQSIPGNTLAFHSGNVGQRLFISPDGHWLAGKGGYGYRGVSYPLQVWKTATGELVAQLENPQPSHRLVSSFAGDAIISLYADGTLTRWAFAEGAAEETMGRLPVYAVRYPYFWSPDGRKLATPTDYQFVIWDVESTQPVAVSDLSNPVAAFSPDSQLVALVDTATNEMIVYDLAARAIAQRFADVTARVEGVAFSPDGRYLAYGSGNEVIIVDGTTGVETAVLTGYPADQHITWIIWSPAGSALMAASGKMDGEEEPGMMMVWQETAVGHFRELFRVESLRASYAAAKTDSIALFNPGGTLVALESLLIDEAWLYKIFVYDLVQEKVILEIPDHQLAIWESDELLLTSQEQDERRLTQWDVYTGNSTIGQASDNGGQIFAPTGGYFAQIGTTPANIRLGVEVRDWRTNQVLAQAPVGNDVGQMSWSPDGRTLAASSSNGTLTLWPITWSAK